MAEHTHRIRRLRWQVRAPGADAAMCLRAMLRELMPDVEAALHAALDARGLGGAVQYLDQLQVQLTLPAHASAQMLMQELSSALGRAMQDAAAAMQAMPLSITPGGVMAALASQTTPGGPLDERATLLCALLALKHRAPQALMLALQTAWDGRQDGLGSLTLDGRKWQVREAELASCLSWATNGVQAGQADGDSSATKGLDARAMAGQSGVSTAQVGRTGLALPMAEAAVMPHAGAHDVLTRPSQDGPSSTALQHLQTQLMHYLRTGQMDWVLAGLPADQARHQLQEAASTWVDLGLLPEPCLPGSALPERLGALCRWLSLLSEAQRQVVLQRHGQAAQDRQPDPAVNGLGAAPAVQASLVALMDRVATSLADRLHALALWLDWSRASGSAMPVGECEAWVQEALTWMAGLMAQGPAHDAWQVCSTQLRNTAQDVGSVPLTSSPAKSQADGETSSANEVRSSIGVHKQADHPILSRQAARQGPLPPEPGTATTSPPSAHPVARAPAQPLREPVISRGHLIAQAGMVLLHPYLSRCFQALGLYEQGQRGPMSEALWPRAASVLHWLAMGDTPMPLECDLGLIKLLLGRAEHEALSHGLPALLTHEREEAASLLQAVQGHWPALKGTSVEGLRQSFLQRRGWLEPLDRAWQLRVESAAYDMLLGSLPWGLSMVKLPWMDRPMHVEWSAS